MNDQAFEKAFESLELDPVLFTHEAHLRLGWIHIEKYGAEQAAENLCQQILAFASKHGERDKFNKTVTVAAIKMLEHFKKKSQTQSFDAFIQENSKLLTEFKTLLGMHYGFDIFNDPRAKEMYLAPDLVPF